MEPIPPPQPAPFHEVPVPHASDKKFGVMGLGIGLFAGACSFLYIFEGFRAILAKPYDGSPSKSVLAQFVALSTVQVVLFVLGMSAVIRRREREAIRWATVLIGATVFSYVLTVFLSSREMR